MEGLQIVAAAGAEVVLVDIHMPEMSGIEFARHLQVLERPPAVIFVTAHDRYAVEAFEVNAVDYLTKPVRAVRLLTALKKAANGARLARGVLESIDPAPRRFFSVAERGRMTLVRVSDVIYLRAELKYVTVRTRTGRALDRGIADAARAGIRRRVRADSPQLPGRAAVDTRRRARRRERELKPDGPWSSRGSTKGCR